MKGIIDMAALDVLMIAPTTLVEDTDVASI